MAQFVEDASPPPPARSSWRQALVGAHHIAPHCTTSHRIAAQRSAAHHITARACQAFHVLVRLSQVKRPLRVRGSTPGWPPR